MELKSSSVAIVRETVRRQLLQQEQRVKKEAKKRRRGKGPEPAQHGLEPPLDDPDHREALREALDEGVLSEEEPASKCAKTSEELTSAAERRAERQARRAQERESKEAGSVQTKP